MIVVIRTDFRRMHRLGHGGIHRAGRHSIHTDAKAREFYRLLLSQMRKPGLAGAIGNAQR